MLFLSVHAKGREGGPFLSVLVEDRREKEYHSFISNETLLCHLRRWRVFFFFVREGDLRYLNEGVSECSRLEVFAPVRFDRFQTRDKTEFLWRSAERNG